MTERGGFGPDKAKIVCVGEAYGREEAAANRPFVGSAGKELRSWLAFAGIDPDSVYYTNVINKQPWKNDFNEFCVNKKTAMAAYAEWKTVLEMQEPTWPWPMEYNWKPVASGKYLHPKHLTNLPALYREILAREPNLVIPLGNKACWALLGMTGITKIRGAVGWSDAINVKVLPTFHPANIMRVYENKPFCLADMNKARLESEFPEIRRPHRELWLDPNLSDLEEFEHTYLKHAKFIGCDIETEPSAGIVKVVGFSADEKYAICVPFYDPRQEDGNYWQNSDNEALAWQYTARWLQFPQSKIFQNGAYDMSWLWAKVGMTVNEWDDTLLQAHALQPELQKDLATLGSIYTAEPAWKLMNRPGHKEA